MKIRKAKPSDKSSIAGFQIAMASETEDIKLDPLTVDKGVEAVFNDPSKGIYFVAESNGKVIGSLMVTFEWSDWRNGNVWWIQSVYIKPEFRRMGIYSKMYSHVKDIVLKDKNLRGLRLYADKTNGVAQKAYHKLGMDSNHYAMFEWMKE